MEKNEYLEFEKVNVENKQKNLEALKKLRDEGMYIYIHIYIYTIIVVYLFPH